MPVKTPGAGVLFSQIIKLLPASFSRIIALVSWPRQSLPAQAGGGKSGLHRAGCQVTPGGREPTTSATESKPPMARAQVRDQVRVKGCGKSAPRGW